MDFKSVADAPDSGDFPIGATIIDFLPQSLDVDIDGATVAGGIDAPDGLQQIVARENMTRSAGQGMQQIELLGGQFFFHDSQVDGASRRVDPQGAMLHTRGS